MAVHLLLVVLKVSQTQRLGGPAQCERYRGGAVEFYLLQVGLSTSRTHILHKRAGHHVRELSGFGFGEDLQHRVSRLLYITEGLTERLKEGLREGLGEGLTPTLDVE